MFALLLVALAIAVIFWCFGTWRQDEALSKTAELKGRAEGQWRRARERGKEDYEDLKAELREEQELRRRAAADAASSTLRDRPL
jgi:hypothetical protein